MPEHGRHTDGGTVINDDTKFSLKTVHLLIAGVIGVSGVAFRSEIAMRSMRYELQAEITRVENTGDKRFGTVETDIKAIKSTQCAIARSLKVLTSECGRFEP